MHSLYDQFEHLVPRPKTKALQECYEINNYIVINALRYILENDCELEHRNHSQETNWKPSTLKDFLKSMLSPLNQETVNQFDSFNLRYWRVKPAMTYAELEQAYHDLQKKVYGR